MPEEVVDNGTNVNAAATMAEAGQRLEGSEAELVVLPLRLAIDSKQSKLIETALDCIHVRGAGVGVGLDVRAGVLGS